MKRDPLGEKSAEVLRTNTRCHLEKVARVSDVALDKRVDKQLNSKNGHPNAAPIPNLSVSIALFWAFSSLRGKCAYSNLRQLAPDYWRTDTNTRLRKELTAILLTTR